MHSRALLTAILFGSAIAGTRLVAQAPQLEPQNPGGQNPARVAATDGTASASAARLPRSGD